MHRCHHRLERLASDEHWRVAGQGQRLDEAGAAGAGLLIDKTETAEELEVVVAEQAGEAKHGRNLSS